MYIFSVKKKNKYFKYIFFIHKREDRTNVCVTSIYTILRDILNILKSIRIKWYKNTELLFTFSFRYNLAWNFLWRYIFHLKHFWFRPIFDSSIFDFMAAGETHLFQFWEIEIFNSQKCIPVLSNVKIM